MNLFDTIKAYFAIKKAVNNIKEENNKMETQTGVKPGWKTSEFWMTMATNVIAVVGALGKFIPAEASAVVMAIANAVYSISRSITKVNAPTAAATVETEKT